MHGFTEFAKMRTLCQGESLLLDSFVFVAVSIGYEFYPC